MRIVGDEKVLCAPHKKALKYQILFVKQGDILWLREKLHVKVLENQLANLQLVNLLVEKQLVDLEKLLLVDKP